MKNKICYGPHILGKRHFFRKMSAGSFLIVDEDIHISVPASCKPRKMGYGGLGVSNILLAR